MLDGDIIDEYANFEDYMEGPMAEHDYNPGWCELIGYCDADDASFTSSVWNDPEPTFLI